MKPYLTLLEEVLRTGEPHDDRTGVGAYSLFGRQMHHDMQTGFPLLTTKLVPLRQTFNELMWFLSGSTNVNDLPEDTRHWWTPWADDDGSLGRIYGGQLRSSRSHDQGWLYEIDQVRGLLGGIVGDPNGRRHVMSTWCPAEIDKMNLPPCHGLVTQLKCHNDNSLSLSMYQRSADIFIGVPVNIASYALLLELIAKVTGRTARELIITFGDLHLYKNHVDQAKEQLTREPLALPRLSFTDDFPADGSPLENLLAVKWQHVKLSGYKHHPKIAAPVAV